MASATVDSGTTATSSSATTDLPLRLDSIPTVDLRLLSQSELYSLSLCSPSTFDPRRCDDVVIPKIDRTVFNESAGSRKQTYSRLRLAPASDFATAPPSSSLRRRTPHLRSASHNPYPHFLNADPENAENRQILALLKQLFGLDSSIDVKVDNMDELIPIRVDYSDTMPQLASAVSTGQKRKRGRPRKNQNAVILVENKVESQCDIAVPMVTNEIVVYENVEDKDKEIVNQNGTEVDLIQLGSMEDPYGEELRRRTEGMGTEEQLLDFLTGLNGLWASRRKKKRIVDASLLGNALPKGWRLSLSCKKKDGRVWLFCRRYISPNGRQFISCKEISAYLLSLHGNKDANQPTILQSNAGVVAADKMAVVINADFSPPNEKREEMSASQSPLPAFASAVDNYEVQVTMKPGDLPAVQADNYEVQITVKPGDMPTAEAGEKTLHCEKCNLAFNCKDDILQHQLSSHRRRRSKNGESVTDGVIIKGGKYECQFCHKTFEERHRYNGHVGTHIRNQIKYPNELQAVNVEECVGSGQFHPLPHGNSTMQPSAGLESNVAAELVRESDERLLNAYTDKQSDDPKELNDHFGRVDNPMDIDVPKSYMCLDSNALFSNENSEISGGPTLAKNAVDRIEKSCNGQARTSNSGLPFQLFEQTGSDTSPVMLVEPKTGSVSENVSRSSNEQICNIDLDASDYPHTMDELKLEENKVVDNETSFGFCHRNAELNDGSMIVNRPHSESEDHSCSDVSKANSKLTSTASGSEQKICSESIMLTPSGDKEENRNSNQHGIIPSSTLIGNEYDKTGTYESKCYESDKGVQEEKGIDSSKIVPSWNEKGNVAGNIEKEVSVHTIDGYKEPKISESSIPSLSGFEGSYGVEEYMKKVSTRKVQEQQVNDAQNMRNSELIFPFSSSNDVIGLDAVNDNKHERGFEFRAFLPSESEKVFSAENNGIGVRNHVGEENKKKPSASGLLAQPCMTGPSEVYNMNKIFGTQVNERNINVTGNSKGHELCLAFDSGANSSSVELENYDAKGFHIHSGMNQTYGTQSNLDSSGHVTAKEGRGFGMDLHDSSFSDKAHVFQNNFNMMYPRRVWEGPKVDEVGNSGNKFMAGFGSSVPQPVEDVFTGSIWRTGEESSLRNDLTDTSTPLIQSSSSFHTFDILSDKGHEGLFGVNSKYDCNTDFEGLTLGRTEPMEYSFLTAQSSNPLPGESKGFSYNADTQQGFDSSFWLGKDNLMQNITGQNQIPTLCVWCRNEFYQDPAASRAQTGAIGSMCPACSSRISQQFNVL